jgi:hypothetical protein
VNPNYRISDEEPESLNMQNDKLMKKVIATYLDKLLQKSNNFNEFKVGAKAFQKSGFIME